MAGQTYFNKDKQQSKTDIFKQRRVLNKNMDNMTKSEKLMNGIGLWASWYRLFPHLFVRDYFGVNLKTYSIVKFEEFMSYANC